jgi:hypothetical protein
LKYQLDQMLMAEASYDTQGAAPSDRKKVASWTRAIHGASSALELTYSKHGNHKWYSTMFAISFIE